MRIVTWEISGAMLDDWILKVGELPSRGPFPEISVRDYFSTILSGLPISRSGASQTLLPLCGSAGIHRLKRPGY